MKSPMIFHSVNAGLFLFYDGIGVAVDALHEGRAVGCSPMPEQLARESETGAGLFTHVTGTLFTHLHQDHFDRDRLEHLLRARPELPVYGPGLDRGRTLVRPIRPGLSAIYQDGLRALAGDTAHDGAAYRNTPHQSYLLRLGGESYFVAGDARLTPEDTENFYDTPVAAGFFNLYQLAAPEGLEFIRRLRPGRVFLYHLPFPEDDVYSYRRLARQVLRQYPKDLSPAECLRPMEWIDHTMPEWAEREENHALSGI